jgi:hypothetical protein
LLAALRPAWNTAIFRRSWLHSIESFSTDAALAGRGMVHRCVLDYLGIEFQTPYRTVLELPDGHPSALVHGRKLSIPPVVSTVGCANLKRRADGLVWRVGENRALCRMPNSPSVHRCVAALRSRRAQGDTVGLHAHDTRTVVAFLATARLGVVPLFSTTDLISRHDSTCEARAVQADGMLRQEDRSLKETADSALYKCHPLSTAWSEARGSGRSHDGRPGSLVARTRLHAIRIRLRATLTEDVS